jgi:hypothetical protein
MEALSLEPSFSVKGHAYIHYYLMGYGNTSMIHEAD